VQQDLEPVLILSGQLHGAKGDGEWVTAHYSVGVPDEEVVDLQKRWSS
jgi:hypothetical protein